MTIESCKVELYNIYENGRIGQGYMVCRYVDGCRANTLQTFDRDERAAREFARVTNEQYDLMLPTPKPFVVHEQSIGYGRTVMSAHAGKFANFLIEVDSGDYKAHSEALKACTESECAAHPADWPETRNCFLKQTRF